MSARTFWSFYSVQFTFLWPQTAPVEQNDSLNHPHMFEEDVGKLAPSREYKNAYCRGLSDTVRFYHQMHKSECVAVASVQFKTLRLNRCTMFPSGGVGGALTCSPSAMLVCFPQLNNDSRKLQYLHLGRIVPLFLWSKTSRFVELHMA